MLEDLRGKVLAANLLLPAYGLASLTWGNASGYDPQTKLVVIKPSGVPYEKMGVRDLVILDLEGHVKEGSLRPSTDAPTHLALYKAHPELGGIVHTHSPFATAFAQSKRPIPCYGTTQADAFFGEIPLARELSDEEIEGEYEKNTGLAINEFLDKTPPGDCPGILLPSHGVFAWGDDPIEAAEHAKIIEEAAKLAFLTEELSPGAKPLREALLRKHYLRKHGPKAYYGQGKGKK